MGIVLHSYLGVSWVWSRGGVAIGSPRARYVDGWRAPSRVETRCPGLSSPMCSPWGAPPSPAPPRSPRELRAGPFVAAPLLPASPTTSPLTEFTVLALWPTGKPAHGHLGRQGSQRGEPRSLTVPPELVGGQPERPGGSKEAQRWEVVRHTSS